mmetsp:Transcript_8204/g.20655  ORF Transcript_8204/g.20655 Transcript_8204/m.20655 type:complete len:213 (-) Transcript_8204:570-1208(-)
MGLELVRLLPRSDLAFRDYHGHCQRGSRRKFGRDQYNQHPTDPYHPNHKADQAPPHSAHCAFRARLEHPHPFHREHTKMPHLGGSVIVDNHVLLRDPVHSGDHRLYRQRRYELRFCGRGQDRRHRQLRTFGRALRDRVGFRIYAVRSHHRRHRLDACVQFTDGYQFRLAARVPRLRRVLPFRSPQRHYRCFLPPCHRERAAGPRADGPGVTQ